MILRKKVKFCDKVPLMRYEIHIVQYVRRPPKPLYYWQHLRTCAAHEAIESGYRPPSCPLFKYMKGPPFNYIVTKGMLFVLCIRPLASTVHRG
jgi:hypothetical protein